MPIYQFDLPLDSDVEPCPMACGGMTEDAAGGPCQACWDKAPRAGREYEEGDDDDE